MKNGQVEVKLDEHLKAIPAALNIWIILKANRPAKGSIYLDHVRFLVRSHWPHRHSRYRDDGRRADG